MTAGPGSAGQRWQRRPGAQRLRWADGAQLKRLGALVDEAEAAWRRAWGIDDDPARVRCAAIHQPEAAPQLQLLAQSPRAAAWVRWAHEEEAALFPGAPATPLATAARAACRRDREDRLARALGLEQRCFTGEAASAPSGRWSGAARALLPCGSELVVDAGCLAALDTRVPAPVRMRTPVQSVAQAATSRRVHVQARLAECTLEMGALLGLQPGDVVRLDHTLSAPLFVHAPGGALLCSGFLVARAGRKAVELAALPPTLHQKKATP